MRYPQKSCRFRKYLRRSTSVLFCLTHQRRCATVRTLGGRDTPAVNICFATGKTGIGAKDRDAIATVLTYLKAYPAVQAVISGYHDPRGQKAKTKSWQKNRAISVRDVLMAAGVEESRFDMCKPQETTGAGDNAEARHVELTVE